MTRVTTAGLVLVLLATVQRAAAADEIPRIPDEQVNEALHAAKGNRAELEQALARLGATGDPRRVAAIRFLVANMPGKGYVVFALKDKKGGTIPFDPLSYPDFKAAEAALDSIDKERGGVDFEKERTVLDVETVKADFLVRHVENALKAWERPPPAQRVAFDAFLNYVLPYRGSEEPLDDWMTPCLERYRDLPPEVAADPTARRVLDWVSRDAARRVPFDERWYLHPTDQSFSEMEASHGGRCEDITNMTTFAARARGLAVAQDYTPRWGHRDNNHAWPVLLGAAGLGAAPEYAHAAKVYRKTFAIQRDGLASALPAGREAPNRWIAGQSYVDVTDQYDLTTDVTVPVDPAAARGEAVAYLCVFSGGEWFAMAWARIQSGRAVFPRMGRGGHLGGMAYLPAVHDGKDLVPVGPPFVLRADGRVQTLPGSGSPTSVALLATSPEQTSVDTKAVTPVSHLRAGETYELSRWDGAWKTVRTFPGGAQPPPALEVPSDGLYWLVAKDSKRLERIFTVEGGRQRFW